MTFEHLDEQLCRQCGGRCCDGHPGVWSSPERFFAIFNNGELPTASELARILEDRQLTLRDVGGILIPAPRETEHGCAALGENGCIYDIASRPGQCLALVPKLDTLLDDLIHCSLPPEHGSGTARKNWRPFQPLLIDVSQQLTASQP